MEPIQVFDEGTQTFLTVYVAKEVVQKCRADNAFAEDLYAQIRDQKVEEGSILEIQTELVERAADVVEVTVDSTPWSKRETLSLLTLYRMHSNNFPSTVKKMSFWTTLSKELAKKKIEKSPEECIERWKTLLKTYRASAKRRNNFPYYKDVDDILKRNTEAASDFSEAETSIDEGSIHTGDGEKEKWSKRETKKFLDIVKKKGVKNSSRNSEFWIDLSTELAKEKIFKAPVKCMTKWGNLLRTFKSAQLKGKTKSKFAFYQEVEEILKDADDDFQESLGMEGLEEEDDCLGFDTDCDANVTEGDTPSLNDPKPPDDVAPKDRTNWSEYETLRLINLYKNHRHKYSKFRLKEEFWNMLAEELKKEGYRDKDGARCRDKIRNLIVSCTNSDGITFKYAKAMEEILRSEPSEESEREEGDSKNGKPKWTQTETAALLKTYQEQLIESPDSSPDWLGISNSLRKSPDECRRRWEDLLSIYRTHKDLNLGETGFVHFEAMDQIVRYRPGEVQETNAADGCLCRRDSRDNKEKRHRERMELMRRKLDIEERKVAAFEEYLRLMKKCKSE